MDRISDPYQVRRPGFLEPHERVATPADLSNSVEAIPYSNACHELLNDPEFETTINALYQLQLDCALAIIKWRQEGLKQGLRRKEIGEKTDDAILDILQQIAPNFTPFLQSCILHHAQIEPQDSPLDEINLAWEAIDHRYNSFWSVDEEFHDTTPAPLSLKGEVFVGYFVSQLMESMLSFDVDPRANLLFLRKVAKLAKRLAQSSAENYYYIHCMFHHIQDKYWNLLSGREVPYISVNPHFFNISLDSTVYPMRTELQLVKKMEELASAFNKHERDLTQSRKGLLVMTILFSLLGDMALQVLDKRGDAIGQIMEAMLAVFDRHYPSR